MEDNAIVLSKTSEYLQSHDYLGHLYGWKTISHPSILHTWNILSEKKLTR